MSNNSSSHLFNQLGDAIEQRWLAANYNEQEFPAIAKGALEEFDLPSKTDPWEALEWALSVRELPRQMDLYGRFAQPPVTLYLAPRFHVDVYFWFTSTTTLHQHNFCGAFQVFEGSSLHSWYEFDLEQHVNVFTEIGKLDLKVCQVLEKGMTQEIWPGRPYIHSLFHLDEPSMTIVVRTHRSPVAAPQYNYFKPGLALDPFFEDETGIKKLQLVRTLLQARRPDADGLIANLLKESDLQTSYNILSNLRAALKGDVMEQAFGLSSSLQRFEGFLALVEERHGEFGDILRPIFHHMDLQDHLVSRRHVVTKPEERFFLALLMNLDTRDQVLDLLRTRYGDQDPVEKVLDWVLDLSETRIMGQQGNPIGIDMGAVDMLALEGILRGKGDDEIAREYCAESGKDDAAPVTDALEKLRGCLTLRPLLA